jgi:hypothetical protein
MSKPDKGKSPYARHNKRPHRYSEAFNAWRSDALSGRETAEAAERHTAYVVRNTGPMPGRKRQRRAA